MTQAEFDTTDFYKGMRIIYRELDCEVLEVDFEVGELRIYCAEHPRELTVHHVHCKLPEEGSIPYPDFDSDNNYEYPEWINF